MQKVKVKTAQNLAFCAYPTKCMTCNGFMVSFSSFWSIQNQNRSSNGTRLNFQWEMFPEDCEIISKKYS